MTTALPTHHRTFDPIAVAVAVAVVIGGAAAIGVVVANDEPAAPQAPPAQTRVDEPPSARIGGENAPAPTSRIGLGDFTRTQAGDLPAPLKGGHTTVGLP